MTEATQPNPDSLDQQLLTRDVLEEITATGDSKAYGEDFFHWMILQNDRDNEGLSFVVSDRAKILKELDAKLRGAFGYTGIQQVAGAMAAVVEDVRAQELSDLYY